MTMSNSLKGNIHGGFAIHNRLKCYLFSMWQMKYDFSLVPTIYWVYLVDISPKQLVIEIRIFKITVRNSQASGYLFLCIYPDPAIQLDLKMLFGINVAHLS